jgi:hypothetical protein
MQNNMLRCHTRELRNNRGISPRKICNMPPRRNLPRIRREYDTVLPTLNPDLKARSRQRDVSQAGEEQGDLRMRGPRLSDVCLWGNDADVAAC